MGNGASKPRLKLDKEAMHSVVRRRNPNLGTEKVRPVSSAAALGLDTSARQRQLLQQQQNQRPLSMHPSSTRLSDTHLVINQLCSKRPKYCLLKQIDLDQLDDRLQFLLFESACDLLDQLSTIDRLKADRVVASAATSMISFEQELAGDYRSLSSEFIANVVPEVLASSLPAAAPADVYAEMCRALVEMMHRAEQLRATTIDGVLTALLTPTVVEDHRHQLLADLPLRREVELLLAHAVTAPASSDIIGWSSRLLPCSSAAAKFFKLNGDPSNTSRNASRFFDSCAAWCWRATVGCYESGGGRIVIEGATTTTTGWPLSRRVKMLDAGLHGGFGFDPRIHTTLVGQERPGVPVDCLLWPALLRTPTTGESDCDTRVLCKALVLLARK